MFEKLWLVTRKTRLAELVERFGTLGQARFYLTHAGQDFAEYQREDDAYRRALEALSGLGELGPRVQQVDRALVPTLSISESDAVVTLGQDGLVANVAKYAGAQPLVAINPDPERFDGILLPFQVDQARAAVGQVLSGRARVKEITLAEAVLDDGQRLLAFNDLFIGAASHVSARYRVHWGGRSEAQSSSGIIVSTGAGSTGWMSSVFQMGSAIAHLSSAISGQPPRPPAPPSALAWNDPRLLFVVREPFASRHSGTQLTAGCIGARQALRLESMMPSGGVIFSDGIEADRLEFNAGRVATIAAAERSARLVVA